MSSVGNTSEENVAVVISGLDACRRKNQRQQLAMNQLSSKIERVQMGTKRKVRRNLMAQFEEAELRKLKEQKSRKAAALAELEKEKEAAAEQKEAVEEVLRMQREEVQVPNAFEDRTEELERELGKQKAQTDGYKRVIQLQRRELAKRKEQLASSQQLPTSRRDDLRISHQKAMEEKKEKAEWLEGEIRRVQTAHLQEERQWNQWMVEGAEMKAALREQLDTLRSRRS